MVEISPDEIEKNPETIKSVVLTSKENLQMFMGDPQSEKTKKIMDKHGIRFGDTVVVNVDGQKPVVVDASEHDFWTRDKAASEALTQSLEVLKPEPTDLQEAAGLAKVMLGETAPNNAERHDELVTNGIEPLGEEALENTIGNAELFTDQAESGEKAPGAKPDQLVIPAEVVAMIKTGLVNFENAAEQYDNGIKSFDELSGDVITFQHAVNAIEGTYGIASLQTSLRTLHAGVQQKYQVALKGIKQGREEMNQSAKSVSTAAGGIELLQDVSKTIEEMKTTLTPDHETTIDNKLRSIRSFCDHLNAVIQTSYKQGFNEGELQGMLQELRILSQNNQELFVANKFEEPLAAIRTAMLSENT